MWHTEEKEEVDNMNINTFEIIIGGVSYASNLSYPIEIKEKSLTESFSTYKITLNKMTKVEPFFPNTPVQLV